MTDLYIVKNWKNEVLTEVVSEQDALVVAAGYTRKTGDLTKVVDTATFGGFQISLHEGRIVQTPVDAGDFAEDGAA